MVEDSMRHAMVILSPTEELLSLFHKAWLQTCVKPCCIGIAADPAVREQML